MQYVGRAIGTVSKTWNSINPATLSGAIDIIVVEREDGEYERGGKRTSDYVGGVRVCQSYWQCQSGRVMIGGG